MSHFSRTELLQLGLAHVGDGVRVSRLASLHNPSRIRIGDRSRIDDFCVLSAGEGGISIGCNVHVAVYTSLIGAGEIVLDDFSNLSSRVAVYSSNDDYSGRFMTGPTLPGKFTRVTHGPVRIGRHVIIGAGSIILPNVTLHEGCAVGALSLVTRDCDAFGVFAGVPAKRIKSRARTLLELEAQYLAELAAKDSA